MTDRRADIDELEIRTNRLDLLSRLADDLAHEIKNPLNAVVVNVELMKRMATAGKAEAVAERGDIVTVEVARAHALVDALLRALRADSEGDRSELAGVIRDLAPLIAARASLADIAFSHQAADTAVVALPRGALSQVLLNLVDNAFAAMPDGGSLEVAASVDDGIAEVRVADTGPGLGPDRRDRWRTPAAAAPPDRRGLGLRVALALAETAGGELELVRSGPDGTTFVVRLPLAGSA